MTPGRARLLVAVSVAYGLALAAAAVTVRAAGAFLNLHPLLVTALADAVATLVVFGFSVRHDNSSLYDPYWSVAPLPIVGWWLAAAPPGAPPLREALVAALVAAWGVRLTANCLVRWRSLADEDFRYVEIRRRSGRLYWPASLLTIHLFPTTWVFLGLLPLWPALSGPARPPGWLDAAAALVTAAAVAIEALADLQLRRFLSARRDPAAVLDTGLWAAFRHPNYVGEVLFWWGLWLFGLAADPGWWWTVVGPLAITALFTFVSAPWMDRRMAARHPAWAARLAREAAPGRGAPADRR